MASGRGISRIEWEEHMRKMKEKVKNSQEATRWAKARKTFLVWLMQPETWKGNKGLEEEEDEKEKAGHRRRRRGRRRRRRRRRGGKVEGGYRFQFDDFPQKQLWATDAKVQSIVHASLWLNCALRCRVKAVAESRTAYLCAFLFECGGICQTEGNSASLARRRTWEARFRMVENLTSDAR